MSIYTFFVILHLIFVGFAVGITAVSFIGRSNAKKGQGTLGELLMIRSMANLGKIMGSTALIGLLVTGIIMSWLNWSFFPFGTAPWLALKQCVYLLVMAVAFGGTIPNGEKIMHQVTLELQGPNAAMGASSELRAMVSRQFAFITAIGIMVLINMTLGESKAMMWVAH